MTFFRYAIGNAERPGLAAKIGWLDHLANDTHQFYFMNNTGGPSLRVSDPFYENVALSFIFLSSQWNKMKYM